MRLDPTAMLDYVRPIPPFDNKSNIGETEVEMKTGPGAKMSEKGTMVKLRSVDKENITNRSVKVEAVQPTYGSDVMKRSPLPMAEDCAKQVATTFSLSEEIPTHPVGSLFEACSTTEEEEFASHSLESRDCSFPGRNENGRREAVDLFVESTAHMRTHVDYSQPYLASRRALMFLASSSESWTEDVARETSLFDDDDSRSDGNHECTKSYGQPEIRSPLPIEGDSSKYTDSNITMGSKPGTGENPLLNADPVTSIESLFHDLFFCFGADN